VKDGRRIDCELRDHGEAGVEVQLWRDGEFYAGRRFDRHDQAKAHAEWTRQNLQQAGWLRSER
jgi:hypothetical protein